MIRFFKLDPKLGLLKSRFLVFGFNSLGAKFQTTFVVCFVF